MFLLIIGILFHVICASSGFEQCGNITENCPVDHASWIQRARTFKCQGKYYGCILTDDDRLIEGCIHNFTIHENVTGNLDYRF